MNKYIVLLGDGMADLPIEELGGKTPLEYAKTDNMDFIAQNGQIGMVATIPEGFEPGSDVANMNILGYAPSKYYTGRAPLEAVNMGIDLKEDQIAFRMNFVCLSEGIDSDKAVMEDFSAGHISTEESAGLVASLQSEIGSDKLFFREGVGYRNILLWSGDTKSIKETKCSPPHDISQKEIKNHLPSGSFAREIIKLTKKAEKVLKEHPINTKRLKEGKKPANSIWLWGQGGIPSMPPFYDMFGLRGRIISAVDLINGLGRAIGLEPVHVEGATGYIDTNYLGKANAALEVLRSQDFVFVHVEAPDEAGHNGSVKDKVRAIEDFDSMVVGTVLKAQKNDPSIRIMVLCDHATPVSLRTHTDAPVPFLIYPSIEKGRSGLSYSENSAMLVSGKSSINGTDLMSYFSK